MKVDIEEVNRVRAYLASISAVPLEQIVWTRDGEVVEFPKAAVDGWKFLGLSNWMFPEHAEFLDRSFLENVKPGDHK